MQYNIKQTREKTQSFLKKTPPHYVTAFLIDDNWKNLEGVMKVETTFELDDKILVVHVTKELDHHIAKEVKEQSDKLMKEYTIEGIIFDFTNTTFMDSSGIGMIMGRYKKLEGKNGFVGVAGVNPSINRILEISGLYKIVQLYQLEKQ